MREQIEETVRRLSSRASGVLARRPFLDAAFPESSDLDFLAFAELDDLYPERVSTGRRPVDVTWLPSSWLAEPRVMAMRGLIGHRLLTSEPLFWRDPLSADLFESVRTAFYEPDVHARRIAGFFEMASLTVREIGITWEFPALALFWLHMSYVACLAAALEGRRRLCPNVYTQPFGYLADLGGEEADRLRPVWTALLRLDRDVGSLAAAASRIHAAVAARFPEPDWPEAMRASTRAEYRYWLSGEERDYRLAVAGEMQRAGQSEAAVHYLRFYVYSLARIPMVHARAAEGRDVAFLRPEQAVLPDLERHCPEILADLAAAFAGPEPATAADVRNALDALEAFRERTEMFLRTSGLPVRRSDPWKPFERSSRDLGTEAVCRT